VENIERALIIMDLNFDTRQGYCRKLGHYLTFKYCRQEHHGLPCPKIRDCWFNDLNVDQFIRHNYKPEEIEYILQPAKPKISTIIDLIRQAQENQNSI
jgi:hypothetical protein